MADTTYQITAESMIARYGAEQALADATMFRDADARRGTGCMFWSHVVACIEQTTRKPVTYLSVVNTLHCGQKVMHSAAEPYAVVACERETGKIREVISRHRTYNGACIACSRHAKASNREWESR